MFSEAIAAFVEGDKQIALSILRDLVHAHISFKTLSEQTGFDEKGLHRMLRSRGNPTTQNLSTLLHAFEQAATGRLVRPSSAYTGVTDRAWVMLDDRG